MTRQVIGSNQAMHEYETAAEPSASGLVRTSISIGRIPQSKSVLISNSRKDSITKLMYSESRQRDSGLACREKTLSANSTISELKF